MMQLPTIAEIVQKARDAEVIDDEFAEELLRSTDLDEVLDNLASYLDQHGHNYLELFSQWDVIE